MESRRAVSPAQAALFARWKEEDKQKIDKLRQKYENILYQRSTQIVAASLLGSEIDDDEPKPPEEWVKTHGEVKAKRIFRIAKDGRKPRKERPGYLDTATTLWTALTPKESDGQRSHMPVQMVQVVNNYNYPEQDVE